MVLRVLKMDLWVFNLQLVGTLMSVLGGISPEITVRHDQLRPCEKNEHLCVTDPRDCDLRPSDSLQQTLNMTCYYQKTRNRVRSVTCAWGQEADVQSDASLIFSSEFTIVSCRGIFNLAADLNVTVRMGDPQTGREIWSRPHSVKLLEAVKPLQSVVTVLGSTEDSLVVSWKSGVDGSCRLRYRPNRTRTWTQISDVVAAHADQNVNYTIRNLLPFNVYRAAVACRGRSGFWSDWSSDTNGRTLDRVPSRPSEVCYRVQESAAGSLLHLKWKAPGLHETEGRVLGYQVSLGSPGKTQNVSETTALVMLEENHSVAVQAFNTAGLGPAAQLQIDSKNHITPPSVRNLWISSCYPKSKQLLVRWTSPAPSSSAPPFSHVVVEWSSERRPSTRGRTGVNGVTTSVVIQDVDPEESYLISVFPVHHQRCGSPQSLTASLQQGAMMEAVGLKVVSVTTTTMTIMWAWQPKSAPIRVKSYRVMLRRDSDAQTLSLWPDQRQHTFFNLTPNTEYSVLLLADNVSRSFVTVTTYFDEGPAAAVVTPLLLLVVTMTIITILSRTVYKSYFFPYISSPKLSSTGQWLMSPNPEHVCGPKMILDVKDFEVTDFLGNTNLILAGSNHQRSSEDLNEDTSPLSIGNLMVQVSTVGLNAARVGNVGPIRDLLILQSCGDTDLTCEMDYLTNICVRTKTEEAQKQETEPSGL